MKKQSTTVLSFNTDRAVERSHYERWEEKERASQANKLIGKMAEAEEGTGLLKFCRELSVILIKQYMVGDDAKEVRRGIRSELKERLRCSEVQADCLIDLALEILHVRVHGKYQRSEVELTYLIAKATGAVGDVALN